MSGGIGLENDWAVGPESQMARISRPLLHRWRVTGRRRIACQRRRCCA
jgi:hypothetical protein